LGVIQLSNVTLILGAGTIFRELSWEIQGDQKIGLIGPNGAGKSSLLRLITGEHSPEPGSAITRARGISIGYLAQQIDLDLNKSALELAMQGNPRVQELHEELARLEASLGDPVVFQNAKRLGQVLDRQQQMLEEYTALGGDSYEQRGCQTLTGLGVPQADIHKPLGQMSGGQKKLVGLARLLLAQPDLLLLDEPDNHLDLPGKAYLERLIRDYPGSVVIVSHDRYLLDACVTHIAEIEDGKLSLFSGDYSSFMADKAERLARQQQLYQAQQHEIERLENAIKRYALWGRLYDNEKFAKRSKAMQTRLDRVEKIERPTLERHRMSLNLAGWRGSNKVLELQKVSKAFGSQQLINSINQTIWHGERVGLIGPNGAGKSVLLRMILGQETADVGEILLGPSVKCGYYAQEHETLDLRQTLIEAVRSAAALSEANAVALLRRYLFGYQQASQKVGDLSGGERSRLQLALVVLSGANFLLLDEPTNNLDIASAEVLEEALDNFVGTVLVISHDRYFLDQTVQRLWVLGDGDLRVYEGSYSDYLATTGGA
jgi:ATP-binding cassette subfamily F protein 3